MNGLFFIYTKPAFQPYTHSRLPNIYICANSGVNSLQILAYIALAQNVTGDPVGFYENAYQQLTNATNQVPDGYIGTAHSAF